MGDIRNRLEEVVAVYAGPSQIVVAAKDLYGRVKIRDDIQHGHARRNAQL